MDIGVLNNVKRVVIETKIGSEIDGEKISTNQQIIDLFKRGIDRARILAGKENIRKALEVGGIEEIRIIFPPKESIIRFTRLPDGTPLQETKLNDLWLDSEVFKKICNFAVYLYLLPVDEWPKILEKAEMRRKRNVFGK